MAVLKRRIEKNMELQVEGTGSHVGSLQHTVMTAVSEKKYDEACDALNKYKESRKYYPSYAIKTDKLFVHAEELIQAIKAKKNFPNLAGLTQNKQEELSQKVKEHWEELRICLRRVKTIERDLETEDAKSSLWVVRAVMFATMLILIVFIIKEALWSMGTPLDVFVEDMVNRFLKIN
ncbi:MAG: hypothetical protein IPM57_02940 [Oligoflexia bacterium]|nr:hypothetical protein [Oligoflexia bacterium]